MKKFVEMNDLEKKEISKLFANWLRPYTHEVIVRVLERRDQIINDAAAMHLLRELLGREAQEASDFASRIDCLLHDFDGFSKYDPHNHALSHARSYRDVLYDMYIK